MPIDRYFKLYLNAGRSIPLVINANQYDSGETWYFSLFKETGEAYLPSSGAIIGIKADGHVIDNAATVDSRGRVVVTETEQMTAAPGKSVFELSIDGNTHGTANFVLLVEPKPSDGGILSDSDLSLIQEAIDSTSPAAIAQGVSDWMDDHLAPSQWIIDNSLTVQGAAADAKKTGDEIADLKSAISGGGLTAEVKSALMAIFDHIGGLYTDANGRTYIEALRSALYPPANLSYITAVYTQSGTVYDTDTLDSLKADLVVTAHYSDSTTEVVTAYTLSGTLTEGTSTITVAYGGKTTTFTVTVSSIQSVAFELGAIGTTGLDEANPARARSVDYIPIEGTFTYNVASGSADADTIGNDTISAVIGGIDGSTGGVIEQSNRVITQLIATGIQKLFTASNDKGYYIKAFTYGSQKNYLSQYSIGGLNTDSISGTVNNAVRYVRLVFKKPDNSDFTAEELASIKLTLNHFKAGSDLSVNASQGMYSFRVYDSSKNFLMMTGDGAANNYPSTSLVEGWFTAGETDYYVNGLPANSKYIRAIARDVAGSNVSSVSGTIEIDGDLYAITWEG